MDRAHWAAIGIAILAAGAGAWFWGRPSPAPPVAIERPPSAPADGEASITVHVSGAVARPGLVELAAGARVADAIAGVGGVLPGAELSGVNLADPVFDGRHVVIPFRGAEPAGPAPTGQGKIRLNTASPAELEELAGVGPVLAARIVAYREEHGRFVEVEDLLDVPGIGEAKLAALRPDVVVP